MSGRGGQSAEGLLGPLEYEVMRCLWAASPANVPAVLEQLNDARRKSDRLAYTTVMTVLVRLHDKGLVDRVRRGRGFDYTPRFDEPELIDHYSRREVDELVERYGAVALAHFADAVEHADPRVVAKLRHAVRRSTDA
ncbi:MAG: BlaI/MecI/CopY family transcriptional regulator [Nitriliruptor sp.]|uniref:BlaI/MecI/CopY family transcriptional regulator n=1 Tax=Nitriliruptor sp. TaxID=2448056 RepID=UPI0034A0A6B3